jgi:hypothetical protein
MLPQGTPLVWPGNTKGGIITVQLTSCYTGLDLSVLQIKIKVFSCHMADSKRVKQEVNGTVILPPLVFPGLTIDSFAGGAGLRAAWQLSYSGPEAWIDSYSGGALVRADWHCVLCAVCFVALCAGGLEITFLMKDIGIISPSTISSTKDNFFLSKNEFLNKSKR